MVAYVRYKKHGWISFSFAHYTCMYRRNPVIFWKLLHMHTLTSIDCWGDYKCFSCCNVTEGSANTWLDTVRSCIRMCDHIPGHSLRLSAVTLDKTLSNHVSCLNCIHASHWCACIKCTYWILVMTWLLSCGLHPGVKVFVVVIDLASKIFVFILGMLPLCNRCLNLF